jgi:hypothetical protein
MHLLFFKGRPIWPALFSFKLILREGTKASCRAHFAHRGEKLRQIFFEDARKAAERT